jgi:membrane associated rhomboid family serine protease
MKDGEYISLFIGILFGIFSVLVSIEWLSWVFGTIGGLAMWYSWRVGNKKNKL